MSGKTVFVNNLKYEATESELFDFFSQAGKVASVTLLTRRGRPSGCAVVEFATEGDCKKAFKLQDMDLMGRPVNVCEDKPLDERRKPTYQSTGRRSGPGEVREIKITGYPAGTRWGEIKDFVEEVYRKPDYAKCLTKESGERFAIVRFDDNSLLPEAVAAINGKEFKGYKVTAVESVYRY